MKMLISEKDFTTHKSRDLIPLECQQCYNTFQKPKNEVQKVKSGNIHISCNYCSKTCFYLSKDKRVHTICKQCNKSFMVKKKQILKTGNFCSSSCSATWNNKKRCKKKYHCLYCLAELNHNKKFCSYICKSELTYINHIANWKTGKISGNAGLGKLSKHVRRYMIQKSNNQCSSCGFNTPHPVSGEPPLQVDHKDGDWANNQEKNLRVLCPNCHALTKTFGGRNHGNGRHTILKKSGYSSR